MAAKIFWWSVNLILYTYLGYPALLRLLARIRPARMSQRPAAEPLPTVTLLIAAHNEEKIIAEKLKNSLALDYPPDCLQILVAADGSDDRTVEIVQSFAEQGVELSYSPPRRGKTAAINRALPKVRGEILVFSDANNFYRPDTVHQLVIGFSDEHIGAVSGAKTIAAGDGNLGEAEGLYWKYESAIKEDESRLSTCTGVAGEVLAMRAKLYEPIPSQIINDDFYIAMRLIKRNYRIAYAPQARSIERVSASPQEEAIRRTRIIAGRYQAMLQAGDLLPWGNPLVVWQVVSHKFLRPLVPLAMIGAWFANLLAVVRPPRRGRSALQRLAPPWNWVFLALQAAFYALALSGGRRERKGKLGKVLYMPYFLLNSNLAALRGLFSFMQKRQSTNWQRVGRREIRSTAQNDED